MITVNNPSVQMKLKPSTASVVLSDAIAASAIGILECNKLQRNGYLFLFSTLLTDTMIQHRYFDRP